ncbi:uncharacterized protein LOC131330201 isoform X2 [Rhododendron vialii]|uniref:uncharacterized protein LOC131330201 isoform X2 n=1 Tax=Rhododendron vialii TaxID=182163 RepID=UPI00265FF30F|nr:uncharacterized protein LOC131330201 isoform X2 [Rhododendron vialii]
MKGFTHPVRATYSMNSCRFNVHLTDETGTIVATIAENMFCVTSQYLKENTHEIKTVTLLVHQQFSLNHHHKSRKQPFHDESSSASMEDDNLPLAVAFMKKKEDYKQPSENTFLRR